MEKNTNKKAKGLPIGARRAIAYAVLILVSLLCLIWFYILFINATRSKGELTRGFTPIPSTHLIQNLKNGVFHGTLPFVRGMLNSLFVAGCSAVLCTYFSTMTAYAIHVYNFRFKKFMSTFILAVMMIPTQVTALGFLQLVGKMKLEDNFIPLIVPAVAAPVTYFYMKQYMESTLPLSLIEAARIDGSGEFRTFNTITIFTFVSSWNNYFIPALVLHKDKMKTLPILIAQLRSADFLKFNMGHVYAAIAFSIFPVIVVYLILSKYIVGGTTLGGVKG